MSVINTKKHWENIYQSKEPNELSWFQAKPQTSLALIDDIGLDKNSEIINVGAGDSRLVDNLLDLGFENITLLDVSSTALEKAKKRLGRKANGVKWVVSDVREFDTNEKYNLWHDRAVLHFLTSKKDVEKYVTLLKKHLKPRGYIIMSAFSVNGPNSCSGLDIRQYSEDSMKGLITDFEHIKSFEESHVTPWDSRQNFIYNVFRKRKQ